MVSNPIPPIARIASSLALGALAGSAACKKDVARAEDGGGASPASSASLLPETTASAQGSGPSQAAASADAAPEPLVAEPLGERADAGPGGPGLAGAGIGDIGLMQHAAYGGGLSIQTLRNAQDTDSFNEDAAQRQVDRIAHTLGACKRPDGPTGHGHVRVIFNHEGRPSQIVVSPPFRGTGVGSCVEDRFAKARVPPFEGHSPAITRGFDVGDST